jgi:hypothetical protein
MAMDWHHYVKRYVWDANKTPFFTAVPKLHKGQADSEIFLYALFLSAPGALLSAATAMHVVKSGIDATIWVGLYAFSVCIAAALLHTKKNMKAAYYSISAPVVLFGYLYFLGFHPNLVTVDKIVIIAVLLLWLRYTVRVVAIAKNYPNMPEKPKNV